MVHINIIRRAVWTTFLAFCLASSLAADCHRPEILKCTVVSLDAAAIERNANSGTPFELVLGETRLKVALSPAPVWPKEGLPILADTKDGIVTQQIVTGNITYAGDVIGEDPATSEVRFTIARGVLEGYVRSSSGWWFLEPLVRFDPKAGPGLYLVYATRDVDFAVDYGDDGVQSDTIYDRNGRIGIVMIADIPYAYLSDPFFFWERQAALLHEVNGIYKDQVGRELKLDYSLIDARDILTPTDAQVLLNWLDFWVAFMGGVDGMNTHIVHLTTAKNLDAGVLGIAHRPGETGLSHQGIDSSFDFQNMMVAAHEIGHNFNAIHNEAEDRCPGENVCMSLMFQLFLPSNVPEFSDGTMDPNKNNRKRVIDNMMSRGF